MSDLDQDNTAPGSLITRSIHDYVERVHFVMYLENIMRALVDAIMHHLDSPAPSDVVLPLHDINATLDAALHLPINAGYEHYPQALDFLNESARQCVIGAATDALGEGCLWDDCDPSIAAALKALNVEHGTLPEGALAVDEVTNYIGDLRDSIIDELSSIKIVELFRQTVDSGLLYETPNEQSFSSLGMDNQKDREHYYALTDDGSPVHLEIAREFCVDGFNVHSVRATLSEKDGQPIGHACFGVFSLEDFSATGPDTLNELINKNDERMSRITPLHVPQDLVFALSSRGTLTFGYHLEIAVEHRGTGLGIEFAKTSLAALKERFPDLRSYLIHAWPLEYLDVSPSAMPVAVSRRYHDDSRRLCAYLSQHTDAFAELLGDDTGSGLCLPLAPKGLHLPAVFSAAHDSSTMALSSTPLNDFRNRIPVTNSKMLEEYLKSPGAERSSIQYLRASIYEFEWGFIVETPFFDGYGWEVVAKRAWETGIDNWHDRFLTAYKNNIFPTEQDFEQSLPEEHRFNITFDDGRINFTSMSFACLRNSEAGRKHFADVYIESYLPDIMSTVYDPKHQFETNWHCVENGYDNEKRSLP